MLFDLWMRKAATPIVLSEAEQETLRSWLPAGTSEQRMVEQAQIILAAAEGVGTNEIARQLGTRAAGVAKWRTRFARHGLTGLADAPLPGPRGALRRDDRAADPGRPRRAAAGRPRDLDRLAPGVPSRRRQRRSGVICVDEKPSIQALERSQGRLRLPDGRALTGFAHEYKRHGTTTLFAALEVASGQVQTGHYARRRRREFLDFMNEVIAAHPDPDRHLHVVLDNLNTHKPKHDRWLTRDKNVHFHFTPPTPAGSTRSRSGSASSVAPR